MGRFEFEEPVQVRVFWNPFDGDDDEDGLADDSAVKGFDRFHELCVDMKKANIKVIPMYWSVINHRWVVLGEEGL